MSLTSTLLLPIGFDYFFQWLNPEYENCCITVSGASCLKEGEWNITLSGMPEGQDFIKYAKDWIKSPTDEDCPVGGKAAFSDAVVIDSNHTTIPASHFPDLPHAAPEPR